MDKNKLKLSKAVSRAVNRRKRKFDELLESDEESDSEENDTEDADDSDNDETTK